MKNIYDYTDEDLKDMTDDELDEVIQRADEFMREKELEKQSMVEYLWFITDWNKADII